MVKNFFDIVSEWLRRRARNPLGFARAGSNPADVGVVFLCNPSHNSDFLSTQYKLALVGGHVDLSTRYKWMNDSTAVAGLIYRESLHCVSSVRSSFFSHVGGSEGSSEALWSSGTSLHCVSSVRSS